LDVVLEWKGIAEDLLHWAARRQHVQQGVDCAVSGGEVANHNGQP
jgi:hypothetical protein